MRFDLAIGLWEWLNIGFDMGALFIVNKDREIRMKTSELQNGFITLTKGEAEVDPGTYWDLVFYVKGDHCAFFGLSLLFGYSYTRKDSDCIAPKNKTVFDPKIVNKDQLFRSWDMHVLHFMAEYDFARKASDIGPRLGFFYNYVLSGRRVFDTSMKVGYIGFDIQWCY